MVNKKVTLCNTCPRRKQCRKMCADVEDELLKLNHSLKSNYLVKFMDPVIIEQMQRPEVGYVEQVQDSFERVEMIRKAMRYLTPVERKYIKMYFGIGNNELMPQVKISGSNGVSRHTIYWHIKRAKLKIRKYLLKHYDKFLLVV